MIKWRDFAGYRDFENWKTAIEYHYNESDRAEDEVYELENFLYDYLSSYFAGFPDPLACSYESGCKYDRTRGICFPFIHGMTAEEALRAYVEVWSTQEDIWDTMESIIESFLIHYEPRDFDTLSEAVAYAIDRIRKLASEEVNSVLLGV